MKCFYFSIALLMLSGTAFGQLSNKTIPKRNTVDVQALNDINVRQAVSRGVAPTQNISYRKLPNDSGRIRLICQSSHARFARPLLVVDGKVSSRELKDIDVNSVESVEILKDAKATALYGRRGVNGVIVLTTKSGRLFQIVDEENGKGLTAATVTFVSAKKDSIRLIADADGKLQTDQLKNDVEYSILVTAVGYKNYSVQYQPDKSKTPAEYRLTRDIKLNDEVVVVSPKHYICRWIEVSYGVVDDNRQSTMSTQKLFPNPVNRGSAFKIGLDAEDVLPRQVKIFNLGGSLLSNLTYVPAKGANQIEIPVGSHWAAGMYNVQIIDNKGMLVQQHKLLVQ